MKPTIGRIVHFILSGFHLPAIIVAVDDEERVTLVYFSHLGLGAFGSDVTNLVYGISHNENKSDYTWHWPEREE